MFRGASWIGWVDLLARAQLLVPLHNRNWNMSWWLLIRVTTLDDLVDPGWQAVYSQMTVHPPKQPEWKLFQFPQRFILKPTRPRRFDDDPADLRRSLPTSCFLGLVDDAIYLMNMRTLKKSYHVDFKYFWGILGPSWEHRMSLWLEYVFWWAWERWRSRGDSVFLGLSWEAPVIRFMDHALSPSLSLIYIHIYIYTYSIETITVNLA